VGTSSTPEGTTARRRLDGLRLHLHDSTFSSQPARLLQFIHPNSLHDLTLTCAGLPPLFHSPTPSIHLTVHLEASGRVLARPPLH
jgi:hypothetical protein